MISYTLCNGDNYYTIKKTLQKTERTSDEEIPENKISYTMCNGDNYYTIKKTLPETEGWI